MLPGYGDYSPPHTHKLRRRRPHRKAPSTKQAWWNTPSSSSDPKDKEEKIHYRRDNSAPELGYRRAHGARSEDNCSNTSTSEDEKQVAMVRNTVRNTPSPVLPQKSEWLQNNESTSMCFSEVIEGLKDFHLIEHVKVGSGGIIEGIKPGTGSRVVLRLLSSLLDMLKIRLLAESSSEMKVFDCEGPGQGIVLQLSKGLSVICTITEQRVALTGFSEGYIFCPGVEPIETRSQMLFSELVDAIWNTNIREERLYDVLIHILFTCELCGDYKCFGVLFEPLNQNLFPYTQLHVDCDEPFNLEWLHGTVPMKHENNSLIIQLIERKFEFPVSSKLQHCVTAEGISTSATEEIFLKPIEDIAMRGSYVGGSYILTSDFGSKVSPSNWNETRWAPWPGLSGFAIDAAASGGSSPSEQLESLSQAFLTVSESAFVPVYLSKRNRLRDERVLYYNGDVWVLSRLEGTLKVEGSLSAQLKVISIGGTRSLETVRLSGTYVVRLVSQAVSYLTASRFLGTARRDKNCTGKVRNPQTLSNPLDRAKVESAVVFAIALLQDQGAAVGGGACILDGISSRSDRKIDVDIFGCQIARKIVSLDSGLQPFKCNEEICSSAAVYGRFMTSDRPILVAGDNHAFQGSWSSDNDCKSRTNRAVVEDEQDCVSRPQNS